MKYQFNLREITYVLSEALDYVGIDDIFHGKRVAYMAAEIAREHGCTQDEIDRIIYVGMLHDCGVSSTVVHRHLVSELDWSDSQEHCIRGEFLLKTTKFYAPYAPYVLYHHTHWDELPNDLNYDMKCISNLIYLADRVDALNVQYAQLKSSRYRAIEEIVVKYSGSFFAPKLVEHFLAISPRQSFWYYLEPESLRGYMTEWINRGKIIDIDYEDLKSIAYMFASIVDAKSPFTSEHSKRVSKLAVMLAKFYELDNDQCESIELAALLHDLGKLRVGDEVLNKPSVLNQDEQNLMDRHSFDSHTILKRIRGFEEIARLASLHHEKLDGKGYPFGLKSDEIPFAARIIAVADVFQALVQNRPYRNGLQYDEVMQIMDEMALENKLDAGIIAKLKENGLTCYECAISG